MLAQGPNARGPLVKPVCELGRDEPDAARNGRKDATNHAPCRADHWRCAIKRADPRPGQRTAAAREFRDDIRGQNAIATDLLARVVCRHGEDAPRVHEIDGAGNTAKRTQDLLNRQHCAFKLRILFYTEQERLNALRPRRKRDGHPRDDAKAALREQTIEIGPDLPFEAAIHVRPAKFGKRRAVKPSIGQNSFNAHDRAEMIGMGRDAIAALERIADQAATRACTGCRHHERQPVGIEKVAEVALGDAGFKRHESPFRIHFDALQPDRSRMVQPSRTGRLQP